ncbi:MAG: glycosyltransferase family 2 protein [Candidatus Cloacimonetes bacterium]|nr:glycosyltransferase family 2 protein [Candidatus Cloacimonadota bacterium]
MRKAEIHNTAVILPVYNSSRHLRMLTEKLQGYFPLEQILAVDDGSTDASAESCRELGLHLIRFTRNKGKGAALTAGFTEASSLGYEFAFSIDSDEQHAPEHIPAFLAKQQSTGAGLVLGFRQLTFKDMPFARICSNRLTSFIVSLTIGQQVSDSQCGYRLYRLADLADLKFKTLRYQFETEILLKLAAKNVKIAEVPVITIYGDETSHISHFRDIRNFVKVVTGHWFKK